MMNSDRAIRVMLVDDHAMVRRGLASFLNAYDDLELVGEASSGEEAIRICPQLEPDVVLMDLVMPGVDGATATREIRKVCPKTRVIALTSYKEEELVHGALQAGALSYLLKDVTAEELAGAIRAAYAGRSTLAPEAAQALIEATRHSPMLGSDLTEREREVLALMAEGLSNLQIAKRLVLGPSTVKFHVSSILSKLGVESRTEAVVLALQKKILH